MTVKMYYGQIKYIHSHNIIGRCARIANDLEILARAHTYIKYMLRIHIQRGRQTRLMLE